MSQYTPDNQRDPNSTDGGYGPADSRGNSKYNANGMYNHAYRTPSAESNLPPMGCGELIGWTAFACAAIFAMVEFIPWKNNTTSDNRSIPSQPSFKVYPVLQPTGYAYITHEDGAWLSYTPHSGTSALIHKDYNSRVDVISSNADWTKVKYNDYVAAYIPTNFLSPITFINAAKTPPPISQKPLVTYAFINAKPGVVLRDNQTQKSFPLYYGNKVKVVGKNGDKDILELAPHVLGAIPHRYLSATTPHP